MSSDDEPRSRRVSYAARACPDFTAVQTGVGLLPVPPRFAGQMHQLHHNALARGGKKGLSCRAFDRITPQKPRTAPQTPRPIQGHHPPRRPPPSDPYPALSKQWERLLTWATFKTLTDFEVMPVRPAREASRRVAMRILQDYGPSLRNWLGRQT